MTDMIIEFTIFFFVDFLLCLVFRTSVCEDELDILFLSLVLTGGATFLIISSSFCGEESVMKDLMKKLMKESLKESVSLMNKDLLNSAVKDSILKTSAAVIFFSIEFSLISTLQEMKIKLIFLSYS